MLIDCCFSDCNNKVCYTNAQKKRKYIPVYVRWFFIFIQRLKAILKKANRDRQWETASLLLCFCWAAYAYACGSRLAAILFLCHANLPCLDARMASFSRKDMRSIGFNLLLKCRPHFLICDCY